MKLDSPPDAKPIRPESVGRMLNILSTRVRAELKTQLSEHNLTMNGFFIVMNLLMSEGQTQAELGQKIALPAYGTTRTIDALEGQGLLERRADPTSRRNHLIFLTAKGRALAPKFFRIVKEVNEWLLAPLEADEKQQFTAALKKLNATHLPKNKKGP